MTRWVMVADLERCVGCQTCTAACRHSNATSPAVQWRKVLDVEAGAYPNVTRTFVPVGCQHCADPPCMHVCPTTATRQRADGIVTVDYDLCIGCAYCEVACPYQARFLVHGPHYAYDGIMQNEFERNDPARLGVAQKCTFCSDRIDFGIDNDLVPGIDPRATPACVNSCIADALHFGDIDDPNSNVSRLLREQYNFRMHAELKTEPGFYYLYGSAANPAAMENKAAVKGAAAPGSLRTKGFEPALQQHWDWKAAGNFICGGLGGGLVMCSAIAAMFYPLATRPGWLGLAIVALGLFLVFLKIGRPLRFIYVLRQPRRSWMAREAWIAGMLFPLAAWALWSEMPILLGMSAILAALFIYSQAMILMCAKGIPAWRTPWIVPLILATAMAEGSGLFLAACAAQRLLPGPATEMLAAVAITFAALRGLIWRAYRSTLMEEGAPARSFAALQTIQLLFFALGLAVPVALVAAGFVSASLASPAFCVAGLGIAGAGGMLKFVLITRAGFNQGFALAHTPLRGSGQPGPAVKPGWLMG